MSAGARIWVLSWWSFTKAAIAAAALIALVDGPFLMISTFEIKNRDPTTRRLSKGCCIYCGNAQYREQDGRKLGDEHVIAESLGGTLVIEHAVCEECERRVNDFEQPILKTVLYAPRVHLGIRRKRRKRGEEFIKVMGRVGGKDVSLALPIKNVPVLLFLLTLGSPGILIGRPLDIVDMRGAWVSHLSSGVIMPPGFESFASPVLDTFKFCQFLAKIAHCFAVEVVGESFTPLLIDLIKMTAKATRYDLVGGIPTTEPASNNLHELGLFWQQSNGVNYLIVRIRLFANLGAPTYLVVAGTSKIT